MTTVTEEATRLRELSTLVEMALDHPLYEETFRALFSIQTALWSFGMIFGAARDDLS